MERPSQESLGSPELRQAQVAEILISEGLTHAQERIVFDPSRATFAETPLQPESVSLLQKSPIEQFFATSGYTPTPPIKLANGTRTTLFPVAGIQMLEPVFYDSSPLPTKPLFIAQPVIRTQFLDRVGPGTSTSFINFSTEQVGATPREHIEHLYAWLSYLDLLGIRKNHLTFRLGISAERWNGREISCETVKLYAYGLEIGDGVFIPSFPQSNRDSFSVSDIGFGLERLRWILRGGDYFGMGTDAPVSDSVRTLTLLCMSGVPASNKERGYRHRLFSKRLSQADIANAVLRQHAIHAYNEWLDWVNEPLPFSETLELIQGEFNRNLRRRILEDLAAKYTGIDIDINMPYERFRAGLRDAGIQPNDLSNIDSFYSQRSL